jgi:signal transduction histidine kinase
LEVDAAYDLPELNLDHERMAQVLGNLITNALRYTPAGGAIRLSAKRNGDEVCIQVSDNGTGISTEDLPFVFGRSFRGDKARQQENGDTGLGLAIAKSLVEAQGGRISVTSHFGLGSTFRINLPVNK